MKEIKSAELGEKYYEIDHKLDYLVQSMVQLLTIL